MKVESESDINESENLLDFRFAKNVAIRLHLDLDSNSHHEPICSVVL